MAPNETKDRFSRIFEVLELLAGASNGMTVTEISKRLGLPLSSTHNLLQRLISQDAVVVTDDLRYSIGGRAVRYGIRIMEAMQVRSIARPFLEQLSRTTGEDVYLAERFGDRVTYTERVLGSRPVSLNIRLGQSLYNHATAVGKLFAAYDPELRKTVLAGDLPRLTPATVTDAEVLDAQFDEINTQGYAVSDEEGVVGIVGFAVPVMDARHRIVAAIHISALAAHRTEDEQRRWIAQTRDAAHALERALGRSQHD